MDDLASMMGETTIINNNEQSEYEIIGYTRRGRPIKKPIKFCPPIKSGELRDDFSASDYDSDESIGSEITDDEEEEEEWNASDEEFVCDDNEIEYESDMEEGEEGEEDEEDESEEEHSDDELF